MPIARQMAAKGSNPRRSPIGRTIRPRIKLTRPKAPTMTLAQTRHSLSSASRSAGIGGRSIDTGSASGVDSVNERRVLVDEEELGDGISVGGDHQEEDQPIPKGEAVERARQPERRMDGEGVTHAPIDLVRTAVKRGEIPNEEDRKSTRLNSSHLGISY